MNDAIKEIQKVNTSWAKEPLRDKTDKELEQIIDSLGINEKYKQLIMQHRDNFGQDVSEIGIIPNTYFTIELEDDATPYYTQPYQ